MLHDPLAQHPKCTRRHALQAGAIGLLGLGMNHLQDELDRPYHIYDGEPIPGLT